MEARAAAKAADGCIVPSGDWDRASQRAAAAGATAVVAGLLPVQRAVDAAR